MTERLLLPYLSAWCLGSLAGWSAWVAVMWPLAEVQK